MCRGIQTSAAVLFGFLSLELGEDLTLCLPDTETSCTPGPLSGRRTREKNKEISPAEGHEEYPRHHSELI